MRLDHSAKGGHGTPTRRSLLAVVLLSSVSAPPGAAQDPSDAEPARVLVLDTYHFANPCRDVVKTETADVLSATKQAEILAVVEALARFRPTRIAIEDVPGSAARIDSLYQAYLSGRHALGSDETEQLGFRLAAMFDHSRVYPVDHDGEFPFEAMMEYARAHDPSFVAFVDGALARVTDETNRRHRENTVGEILRMINEPEELARDHGIYMRFAEVGTMDTYVGARLVSKWYERNIHIFANLQAIAEPGDRILVIIGGGHAPILRELIRQYPGMRLVEALEYLPR